MDTGTKNVSHLDKLLKKCRGSGIKLCDMHSFYWKVIEDTDGVPYQLLADENGREDHLLLTGEGITMLTGIKSEDLSEDVFDSMIEEITTESGITAESIKDIHRKILTGELKGFKGELLVRTSGGEKRWIKVSVLPVEDKDSGKAVCAFGILYDVTEKHNLNEGMERIRKQEKECENLKSMFLQNISHEIRTPLNAIVGFSSLMGENEDGIQPGQWDEFRDIINTNTDHLLEIIDSIIEISKIEAGEMKLKREKANLNWIMLKVYVRYKIDASDKGIRMNYISVLPDREADVYIDERRLTKALGNIVGNAVKFTNKGRIEFGYSLKATKMEFYVSDTGIGIQPEHQEKIFSLFFQADNSYTRTTGGIGLGLSIARAYIDLLGGEISFSSQPGKGSVFRFSVPYEKPPDIV